MSEGFDGRLGYQPDIYQRYGLLAGLAQALLDDETGRVTVLDVGCGPARLTEAFLSKRFTVVRADVSQFGDPEIVLITPGEPLPFDTGAFDLVLGLEVIEHLAPPARPLFIGELQRVARRATIVSCPVATPETQQAERAFSAWVTAVSGRPIEFLAEHEQYGLPAAADVASWFSKPDQVLVLENAPLDDWQVFNALDYIYAADLGDGEDKRRLNAVVNARSWFARSGAAHYRRFFAAFASPAAAAAAARFADQVRQAGSAEPVPHVPQYISAVVAFRASLKQQFASVLAARDAHIAVLLDGVNDLRNSVALKDVHIGAVEEHVRALEANGAQLQAHGQQLQAQCGALNTSLEGLQRDLTGRDAHIATLEARIAETHEALDSSTRAISAKDARLAAMEAQAADLTQAVADRHAEAEVLRGALAGVQDALGARERAADAMASQLAATERQLDGVVSSWSWAITAPMRALTGKSRQVIQAVRRGARSWSTLRTWSKERWARRRDYRAVVESGLFDAAWYRARYPDVATAQLDPLVHYLKRGALECRDPHPLFDARYYTRVAALPAGANPLLHFITTGAREGLDPHPLFHTRAYLEQYVDVAQAETNPLAHYYVIGGLEGRSPHPMFDSSFYLAQNPDVAAGGLNPLAHYLSSGWLEGRDPHPDFDGSFYLQANPDVAAALRNPLVHFVLEGKQEGRLPHARTSLSSAASGYVPPRGLLPWFNPLNITVSAPLSTEPRLNVLVPGLGMRNLSGGPNTALVLAGQLAQAGIRVRLITTDLPPDEDRTPFWAHVRALLGTEIPPGLEMVDGHDRSTPLAIGQRDIFLATAWWTAQQAKYAIRHTVHSRFVYLIQDYEPLLHAASTSQALAEETYGLDHIPVINSQWLYEFLVSRGIGRFRDPEFARQALFFQPAMDRTVFHPRAEPEVTGRRRVLFYARPTGGLRNLFELGVAALQKAVDDGVFRADAWEFVGMGEQFAPVPLGKGAVLAPAPWRDLAGYAAQMRESDILLSLMLSPHPSYPPLEMAASAGLAVTTAYANKSREGLAALTPNIVAVEPTVEAIAEGLATAHARSADWEQRLEGSHINLPQTWNESLADVIPELVTRLLELQGSPTLRADTARGGAGGGRRLHPMFRAWPRHAYDIYRRESLVRRRDEYPALERPGLISFLTPVWNTDPRHLEELAESVLDQDLPGNYEWIVVDNGSDNAETRAALQRLAGRPGVRLFHSDENLGIIAGTRFCLEQATGRYAATVDHDDLLAPDCVRILTYALEQASYPPLAYSDEDKVDAEMHRDPYFKPDWDPVLFAASCYIAHLIVFDRQQALARGAYTDAVVEGSHDWDTFMRFALDGIAPMHIPEVLYTWRMHTLSTAGNIGSKPYVWASHRRVLQKFIDAAAEPAKYTVEPSPLFDGTPDWWIRRGHVDPRPITTVRIGGAAGPVAGSSAGPALDPAIPHEVTVVADASAAVLGTIVERCAREGRLVHLLWAGTEIDGAEWPWEAMAQFEIYPDTVMVGGSIHRDKRLLSAASYFGFGRGCDSPDRGRAAHDPGYFAQMWKPHSASAVPVQHCVVEPTFFHQFLARYGHADVPMRQLGAWLGAFARSQGRRVIYSPFLSARAQVDAEGYPDGAAWATFTAVHRALIPDTTNLSRRLGLDHATAYLPVAEEARRTHLRALDPPYGPAALAIDRAARQALYPPVPRATSFTVLTSVYERTPARLFELTSDSVLQQRRPFDEWVLLVNGPIPAGVETIVARLARDPRIKVDRAPVNLGMIGAMRRLLDLSTAEYVLPVDADDLLEPDALEMFEASLARDPVDFIYSDEDILSDDTAIARYSRPAFDPVLNLDTSYVWHLCAFRRERALALGVYTDRGAEYCHDWDTILRFASGASTVGHVPHVLYRWRTHGASQSHSGVQNQGSVASTRHVLQEAIARQPRPALYEVRPFPMFRGAEEWYIARRPDLPPAIDLIVLSQEASAIAPAVEDSVAFPFRRIVPISMARGWSAALRDVAAALDPGTSYVAILSDLDEVNGDAWVWEAVRLLELHDDVAVVGGRVYDDRQRIIDAGVRIGGWARRFEDFAGLTRTDPGPFALALKPHSIEIPGDAPLIVEQAFLQAALASAQGPVPEPLRQLLAQAARINQRRIAYSPLLEARRRPAGQPVGWARRHRAQPSVTIETAAAS